MLSSFVWILGFIFLVCFLLAIVLTRLIGHGLLVRTTDADEMDDLQSVRGMFSTVSISLFNLFQLVTADDWSRLAYPLISLNPAWRVFFICFIMFMSWTMLSLLNAVASQTM